MKRKLNTEEELARLKIDMRAEVNSLRRLIESQQKQIDSLEREVGKHFRNAPSVYTAQENISRFAEPQAADRERLRYIRKSLGMTFDKFGSVLGYSGSAIHMMESGQRSPEKALRLAEQYLARQNAS